MTNRPPIEKTSDGVIINLKVRPGAGRNRIRELKGGALEIEVKSPPEGGKANRDAEKLVAKAMGLSPDCAKITSGKKSRRKRIRLTGVTMAEARQALELTYT